MVVHHTEILLRFSRFECYTQPRKNEGQGMSALTKIQKLLGNDEFVSNIMSCSYHWNKKHSLKQVELTTYTFGKKLLKHCETFCFRQS